LDAEASEIPTDRPENVGVGFAGVATTGAYLPQAQRAAEELSQFLVESAGKPQLFLADLAKQQVFAATHGHPMVTGPGNGASRTRLDAGGAEDAFAKIERDRGTCQPSDGLRWTDRLARVAAFGAFRRVHAQRAAVAVGQHGRRALGIRHRLAAVPQTMRDGFEGEHSQRSKPQ
jgi:hypothetical protein